MNEVRKGICFILGILCVVGAIVEDPIHLWSLIIGLLLMGVITTEQIFFLFNRSDSKEIGYERDRI